MKAASTRRVLHLHAVSRAERGQDADQWGAGVWKEEAMENNGLVGMGFPSGVTQIFRKYLEVGGGTASSTYYKPLDCSFTLKRLILCYASFISIKNILKQNFKQGPEKQALGGRLPRGELLQLEEMLAVFCKSFLLPPTQE